MGKLERDILDALNMFGVLTVEEIKDKLNLRSLNVKNDLIAFLLADMVKKKLVKKSDVPGYFRI